MRIYLADLTHQSKLGLGSDTMPLQLGLIGSYCQKIHQDKVEVEIFKFIDEFLNRIDQNKPDVIGFSNYVWNVNLSTEIAKLIKSSFPEIIIIMGGPNYPCDHDNQRLWLSQHPEIDLYIYKDGEMPFTQLIGFLLDGHSANQAKSAKLPSCHAIIDGEFYAGELSPRVTDLSDIPSPYVVGLMDKFFSQKLIPAIQTNRGCPFSCSFCAEGNPYYNRVVKKSNEDKQAEIDYIVKRIQHTPTLRITDSNFGMFNEDFEFCKYLGEIQKEFGWPEYINCSAGKNRKELILGCNKLVNNAIRLTASVQSLSPEVLRLARRTNISLDAIMELSRQVSDGDTHSYSEIILGLPGDSLEAQKLSMSGLVSAGISNITQHQLSLIKGTSVDSPETRQEFQIKEWFRPIQRCIGRYQWHGQEIKVVEVEGICASSKTLSFEDYIDSRLLYLTVGLFYNDRIFGEINALLRVLGLSTWDWLSLVHEKYFKVREIRNIYDDFARDSREELWNNYEQLITDVSSNIDGYISGELGGNIIYKYRAKMILELFPIFHEFAFEILQSFLISRQLGNPTILDAVEDLKRISSDCKSNLLDTDSKINRDLSFDIVRMIQEGTYGQGLSAFTGHYKVEITHTAKQRDIIKKQLEFYGSDISGMTMLISRFPLKRFYRKINIVP